jgi:hypothetical protein
LLDEAVDPKWARAILPPAICVVLVYLVSVALAIARRVALHGATDDDSHPFAYLGSWGCGLGTLWVLFPAYTILSCSRIFEQGRDLRLVALGVVSAGLGVWSAVLLCPAWAVCESIGRHRKPAESCEGGSGI